MDSQPEARSESPGPPAEAAGQRRSRSAWPFLVVCGVAAVALAMIFGNLPIVIFVLLGLAVVLRTAYRAFLRPYLRALRMRRARDARAWRELTGGDQNRPGP